MNRGESDVTELRDHFHLFVYGTLKQGEPSNQLLQSCAFIGAAQVHGILYNIENDHPALILYGSSPVTGEVWRCPADMLLQLDEYEGVNDGLYRRVGVQVTIANGEQIGAWTYAAGPALTKELVAAHRIARWPQ